MVASNRSSPRPAQDDRTVPPPVPPDDPDAWYAPDVRAQYEIHPGVVATITETADGQLTRLVHT